MKTLLYTLGLSTALMTMPALAQSSQDWDANSDQQIDREEFNSGMEASGVFDIWDGDASGSLDQTELREGLYGQMDSNQDQSVSMDEWNVHSETFGKTYGDWSPADTTSGFDMEEYKQAFEDNSVQDSFDADQSGDVSENEFSDAAFGATDRDQDGWISFDETAMFDKNWLTVTIVPVGVSEENSDAASEGDSETSEQTEDSSDTGS